MDDVDATEDIEAGRQVIAPVGAEAHSSWSDHGEVVTAVGGVGDNRRAAEISDDRGAGGAAEPDDERSRVQLPPPIGPAAPSRRGRARASGECGRVFLWPAAKPLLGSAPM